MLTLCRPLVLESVPACASDGLEAAYSCLIVYVDNEDDYGSKKDWSKGGQSGPKAATLDVAH